MSKPKPCPFCGTTESIQIDTDTNTCTGTIMHWYATVQCNECEQSEVVLTGDTEEEAIANAISAWNTRHIEDELKVALEATEAERNELETYVSKLVYALTDGKMSKPYDIPVITDAVESIYQEYIREAVAETEAENERLQGMVDWLAHYCASAHAAFQMRYGMEPDERTTVEYWKQGGASLVEEEGKKDENS